MVKNDLRKMWLQWINPQINEMWRGDWQKGFIEPARYLYDHELVCVMAGAIMLTVEEQSFHLQAGQFVIIPPNRRHVSEALSNKVHRACVHFDWIPEQIETREGIVCYHPQQPKHTQLIPTPAGAPDALTVLPIETQADSTRALDQLFTRWNNGGKKAGMLCRGLFIELLTQLYWPASKRSVASRNRGVQLAYAAKELLDQHTLGAQDSIQTLLESLGFSYAHQARLFQQTFGQTPLAYVNARKLERARMLLNDPRTSVQEAADIAGYADVSYFIRSFRRHFGQTPGDYRDGR